MTDKFNHIGFLEFLSKLQSTHPQLLIASRMAAKMLPSARQEFLRDQRKKCMIQAGINAKMYPHQGAREMARRAWQIKMGKIKGGELQNELRAAQRFLDTGVGYTVSFSDGTGYTVPSRTK